LEQSNNVSKSLASIGNELRILRKLRHPNIVMFHGACFDFESGDVALVLGLLTGQLMSSYLGPLADMLSSTAKPSGSDRARCLIGVCRALLYLHSRSPGIVHGDIKPDNIMVECHGRTDYTSNDVCSSLLPSTSVTAKLMDFGLARVRTRRPAHLGGTLRWAAPEVFAKKKKPPQPAADAYSFGCLVHFAATDEVPLASLTLNTIHRAKRRGEHLVLQYTGRLLLEQSQQLVYTATQLQPESRPALSEVYQKLLQWPESRHANSIDMLASASPGQGEALEYWRQIQRLRQSLAAASLHQEPPPRVQQMEDRPLQQQQPPHLQQQNPVMTHATSPQIDPSPRLVHSEFHETPLETLVLGITWAVEKCNFKVPSNACCSFHAAVQKVCEVQQLLESQSCRAMAANVQCPTCLATALQDDSHGPYCSMCGLSDGDGRSSDADAGKLKLQL